jgi:hypothetical protein
MLLVETDDTASGWSVFECDTAAATEAESKGGYFSAVLWESSGNLLGPYALATVKVKGKGRTERPPQQLHRANIWWNMGPGTSEEYFVEKRYLVALEQWNDEWD